MEINYLAVLVCGVASMVIGSLWHSKLLFGDCFIKASGMDIGMTPEKMAVIQKKMWQLYLTQFLLSLLQAFILAQYIAGWEEASGVTNALWIWLGFIMPTVAGSSMWSSRPRKDAWKVFLISAGYQLVLFVVFGFILGSWQ
jgi:hypothetical protein